MILVVWKLAPENNRIVSCHSLQKVFPVDVSTAGMSVGLLQIQ